MGLRVSNRQLKAKDISAALAEQIDTLAAQLLGEPTSQQGHEWRWGRHGSLGVVMRGPKAGSFYDHEQGKGGDALDLIAHIQRRPIADAMAWARDWLGGAAAAMPTRTTRPINPADRPIPDEAERIKRALAIWNEAQDPAGTPVELYLKSRGLQLIECEDIRFHPACPRGNERSPAMVCLMRNVHTLDPTGIHRTFLTMDGAKAKRTPDDKAKQMLGVAHDAAIMLTPLHSLTGGLFVTEGVENGIAAILGGWAGCWALGSAGAIAKFPVLKPLTLSIIADADDAGRRAAKECGQRWADAGCEVYLIEPTIAGADWNDIFAKGAA